MVRSGWAVPALAGVLAMAQPGHAQVLGTPANEALPTARAVLIDSAGTERGEVLLRQTPGNGVLLDIRIRGLSAGTHAVHIHETGVCRRGDFGSAGGHYNPHSRAHGALHSEGMHGGDMVNLHVTAGGEIRAERIAREVSLHEGTAGTLFDEDGSAIIVHAGADDYRSQPSGDAGGRVLCGVVRR